jgi:hypothetical protein
MLLMARDPDAAEWRTEISDNGLSLLSSVLFVMKFKIIHNAVDVANCPHI